MAGEPENRAASSPSPPSPPRATRRGVVLLLLLGGLALAGVGAWNLRRGGGGTTSRPGGTGGALVVAGTEKPPPASKDGWGAGAPVSFTPLPPPPSAATKPPVPTKPAPATPAPPVPSATAPAGVLPLTFVPLMKAKTATGKSASLDDLPPEVVAWSGKRVRLSGYLGLPYNATGEIDLLFLQENPFNGCCIGEDPNFWDSVEVRRADGKLIPLPKDFEYHYRDFQLKVTATGTFRVQKLVNEGAVEQLYFIAADEVVIANHVEEDQ